MNSDYPETPTDTSAPSWITAWKDVGRAHFLIGKPPDRQLLGDPCWKHYGEGYFEAALDNSGRPSAPTVTTQQLIDEWDLAHTALRKHVKAAFPLGCDVEVDCQSYKGPGKVVYYPEADPHKVGVGLPNGNEWWGIATNVRRVE